MKPSELLRCNVVLSILLSVVLFLITYFSLGYYYGWVDDVLVNNYMQGIPIHQPIDNCFTVHFLLSKGYVKLYQLFPAIPWYGIIFGFWIFLATVNFCIFLLNQFSEYFNGKKWLVVLFIIVLYLLMWVENVYLINFSRVAILLMGTSFLNIHRLMKNQFYNTETYVGLSFYSFTFLIGLLTRMELIYIMLPFFVVYAFWGVTKKSNGLGSLVILFTMLLFYKGIEYSYFDDGVQTQKTINHILNVVDGLNTYNPDINSIEKSIKNRLLFNYYSPDTAIVNSDYIKTLGPSSMFDWIGLQHTKRNLLSEHYKATAYNKEYHEPLNWYLKSVGFTAFNLLLLFGSFFRVTLKQMMWRSFAFQLFFTAIFFTTVFFITVLSKMEDRVLNPAFIIFSLAHIAFWTKQNKVWINSLSLKTIIVFALLPLIVMMVIRLNGYLIVSAEKKQELLLKKDVLNELNNGFTGKILFYDIWAMTFLHQTPLESIHLSSKNIHSCYGEYWCNFHLSHFKYLEGLCGRTDFISFFKCLYSKRDKVVFVFSKNYRKELIEQYAMDVYGENIKFKEIMANSKIKKVHYSFVPAYNEFGYYVFDSSFSDAR